MSGRRGSVGEFVPDAAPRFRITVAMTHNTDTQDAWERESEDPRFFERFAPDGYSLGVNVVLHAMSH